MTWTPAQLCSDVQAVNQRFLEFTGRPLDALWRAPSGKTSAAVIAAVKQCGYRHVGWAPAGFSGDELPSESHPNRVLLAKVLAGVRDGDIIMAHMGIWSRRDPWAPTVLPALIEGLQAKGFCFATLREHPDFAVAAGH
ncbi:MAG: polysaccharide deacetylase family protein [Burkholderiales bacterium]|nr:polysaccharide deacetylase family protein [Burkholderiales bacterium]